MASNGVNTKNYIVGFVLSLALTFGAYLLAVHHTLSQQTVILLLLTLAFLQFVVQVHYFLHLDTKSSSRERLIVLGCAALIVLILVVGSLWIMFHLNQHMMADPAQMQQYMSDHQGI